MEQRTGQRTGKGVPMIRDRLTLVVMIVLALSLSLLPLHGATQTSAESAQDEVVWEELAEERDLTVSRGFELEEEASDPFRSDLVGLYTLGTVHATDADARSTFNLTPNYLIASFQATAEEEGYTFDEPEIVEIAGIGERHEALSIEATVEGGFVSLTMGVVTVQQGTWVQMLYGFGFNDEVVEHLAEISSELERRWPNGDPVSVEDGLHTGGPWAMAPVREDLPSELVWIEELEAGPESADDEPAGDAADPGLRLPDDLKGHEEPAAGTSPDDAVTAEATPEPEIEDREGGSGENVAGEDASGRGAESATDEGTGASLPARLVEREPGPLTLWIILPEERFAALQDGPCAGAGPYAGVMPGGVVSLLDEDAGATHIESVMIESPGRVYFDSVLQQDVCAFSLKFTRVVPGTSVLVDLDRVVLGRFDHLSPGAEPGEPAVYEIVVGE